jgi:hypothetical protein
MELSRIRPLTHKHCRFKLKNGREVFGVVWEVEANDEKKLFFASVRDYQRLQSDAHPPINVLSLRPEEIVSAESIAS